MKKTSRRKSRAKARATPAKPSSIRSLPYILTGAAVLIVLGLLAAFFAAMTSDASDVVATVNGEAITEAELSFQYNLLPQSYRETFTREQIIEQIIDETLVVQAGDRAGVEASPADVNERVQLVLSASGITISDLQENLDHFNVSQEEFERLIARQIVIERYLNQTLEVRPADEETLKALYDGSRSQYSFDEQVTVRHILISTQREDAALLAKSIYDDARAGADFCALAQNTSDDKGSRDTCGEYTFPRGFMVPEFEEASFEMAPGEFRMIQTQFGYHIINKINTTPAGVLSYEEVRDDLVAQYDAAERSLQYRKLLNELRSKAVIAYANGTTLMPQQPTAVAPVTGAVVDEAPVEPVVEQPPVEPVVVEPETPVAPVVEPTPVGPETPVAPAVNESLFACIAGKTTLYGASWNTDTRDAIALFERNGVTLDYVACDKSACAGVAAYPTWDVDGQRYLGRMTIEQLKNAASC